MNEPNLEELCRCGHAAINHAFPGALGTMCTHCSCRSFQPKPESEGTSEPSPAGSAKKQICNRCGEYVKDCPCEPSAVPASGEARTKSWDWLPSQIARQYKHDMLETVAALQRELAEAKEEHEKHITMMSTHAKRRTDDLMAERAAHLATRQQLARMTEERDEWKIRYEKLRAATNGSIARDLEYIEATAKERDQLRAENVALTAAKDKAAEENGRLREEFAKLKTSFDAAQATIFDISHE